MAYIQNVRPPKNERLEFTLTDFSGGLNNRSSYDVQANQATDLLNLKFLHHDVLEKRNGWKPFDNFVLNEPITYVGLFQPYKDEDVLIRATDREVYAGEEKIADVSGTIDAVNYQGHFFFTDGEDLYVYGMFTETTSTYTKIIGSHPKAYVTLKVVNPPEGYEPLDKVHVEGVTVYDYNEMTVHYEPCKNELLDPYKGANVLPEQPAFIEIHKGRLYLSGDKKDDDNVFISDIQNPYYFPVTLPIQLPPNSDRVRGLKVYDNSVLVGRARDFYFIDGETNNPELGFELFTLRKLNTHTGLANNRCIVTAHNYLLFLGSDGTAYAIGTTRMDERLVTTQIISQDIDLFKYPISATQEDIESASSCFDSENWYVNIGDKTLVYSYRHKAWTLYDRVDMNAPFMYYDKLIWGRKDGYLAEFSNDYMDNGKPILCYWKSKTFDMGSATRYKQFREFFIVAHTYDDSDSDIRVTFDIDFAEVRGETVIENQLSIWGVSRFGDRFVDRNINTSIPFMIGRRARYFNISFANGYRHDVTVEREIDLLDIPRKYNFLCAYVEETGSYYFYRNGTWNKLTYEQMNQPMCIYQINGDFEMKGKR